MINKYAEINDRILLYNACKGILRVKTARSELESELMQDAFESGKKMNQIDTTFSSDTRPEMQDYNYSNGDSSSFELNSKDDAAAAAAANKFRRRALTLAAGGAGAAGGLYLTRKANPYARVAAATALGGLSAYGAHRLGKAIFAD